MFSVSSYKASSFLLHLINFSRCLDYLFRYGNFESVQFVSMVLKVPYNFSSALPFFLYVDQGKIKVKTQLVPNGLLEVIDA